VGSGAENKKHYTINKKKSIKNTNKKHLGKAKNSRPTPVSPPRRGKQPGGVYFIEIDNKMYKLVKL
jgi:hypothetical protein